MQIRKKEWISLARFGAILEGEHSNLRLLHARPVGSASRVVLVRGVVAH